MDITFKMKDGRFNYRACAVIINNNKLLAMHNYLSPYFYLPGGRVKFNETAEEAVLRELKEELGITAEIVRPLWFNQSFFIEDVTNERFHELCIYFLIDVSKNELITSEDKFLGVERNKKHIFEWLPTESLKDEYLYPLFIKDEIFSLPDTLTMRVDEEYQRLC